MPRAVKYTSYEEWVCGRLTRCKNKTMNTALLMKLPRYLYDLEVDPSDWELERRLRKLRDDGVISVAGHQWTLRGPYTPPSRENRRQDRGPTHGSFDLMGGIRE